MKAIVADLLLSSVVCCLIVNAPAQASSPIQEPKSSDKQVFLSAKVLHNSLLPITPVEFNFEDKNQDFFLSIENTNYFNNLVNLDYSLFNDNSVTSPVKIVKQRNLALGKKPLSHQNEDTNLILGFHPTFWPSSTGKYWGLTSVEQWGTKATNQPVKLKLNRKNPHLLLPEGT